MNTVILYGLVISIMSFLYIDVQAKDKEIADLENKLVNQKAYLEDKVKKVAFNVKMLTKKQSIEEKINYDKNSSSVNINSLRIYY